MSVGIRGFGYLAADLERLQERTESVDGENAVSVDELFPVDFVQTHAKFETIQAFLEASARTVDTEAGLEAIPGREFEEHVDEHTGFSSWEAKLTAGAREWVLGKLAVQDVRSSVP